MIESYPTTRVDGAVAALPIDLPALAAAFRVALAAPDVRRARAMISEAVRTGTDAGRLYSEVVRPALAETQREERHLRARLAAGIGEAILADLVASLPLRASTGLGRAAVLSCRDDGIEAVDGHVAIDFLAADGWKVQRLASGAPLDHVGAIAADGVELAVAVTSGPEDALTLAQACTEMRRRADPPVIVLCDFSGRSRPRAAALVLGADAVAHDPQELVRCAAGGLPASGQRRWGVRLSRHPGALSLSPSGTLDATSVQRLSEVALSRRGTFTRLVVDLSDLAQIEADGLHGLAAWPSLPGLDDVDVVVVAGPEVGRQLQRCAARPPRVVATIATQPFPRASDLGPPAHAPTRPGAALGAEG